MYSSNILGVMIALALSTQTQQAQGIERPSASRLLQEKASNLASLLGKGSFARDASMESLPCKIRGGAGVLISGGTACNSLMLPILSELDSTTHVLPVSDDGGSTAEIRRVRSFFLNPIFCFMYVQKVF
jgi:hypothetical protein